MTIVGEIDRVLAGNPLRSTGARNAHGEWDWVDHIDRRTMRRLTGAGYFARAGLSIDEAADMICARVGGVDTLDDAIAWYVRTALAELDERQADRAGVVRWEDQERPDDTWDLHDPDLLPVSRASSRCEEPETLELDPAELPTVPWDVEPTPVFEPDARPTLYGSVRPAPSVWPSTPDDTSPRRRRRHGAMWWRIVGRWSR